MDIYDELKKSNPLNNGRPTIAILAGSMSSSYHEELIRGADDAAKELGFNLISYSGGPLNSPDPQALNRVTLFDLIDFDLFDGIIIPTSSHTRFINNNDRQIFLDKYRILPLVNIGSNIEGCTNIIPDYSIGITDTISHLVKKHNCKRVAFIRGPENHIGSDLRVENYIDALQENHLELDRDLIFCTDLNRIKVRELADNFINNDGSMICDAILTMNDNQALGLMEEFHERGIRIPEDIAICGSINSIAGLFCDPPLTSIIEQVYELGYIALETISEMIKGNKQPNLIKIPTTLNIRSSCGCSSLTINNINIDPIVLKENNKIIKTDFIDMIIDNAQFSCQKIVEKYRPDESIDTLKILLELFKTSLLNEDFTLFIDKLHLQLQFSMKGHDIITWSNITTVFESAAFKYLEQYRSADFIIKLISRLHIIKNDIAEKTVKFQRFQTDHSINYFREIANYLNSSFNLTAITKYALQILDSNELHLSVYNIHNGKIESATNIMTVKDNEHIKIDPKYATFDPIKLLPPNITSYKVRYSLIVLPLSYRKKPLGFLTLDLSKTKGPAYENMQAIISTALKNELQIEALKKAEERFSDIAHSTSNWLWETDENLNFIYSSDSVLEAIGYSSDEIIGKKIISYSLADNYEFYVRMLSKESLRHTECWYKHKNNKVVCLSISALPTIKDGNFIGYRGEFKDITDQKLQEEKINQLAYTDVLTGLPNRAMFQDHLENTIKNSKEHNHKFALMFLDLDKFKYINDSLGHEAGDKLLISISKILKKATRSNDIIARLGGDEFTIIIPCITSDEELITIADRVVKHLAKPIDLEMKVVHITVSLGISIFPHDGTDSTTLLKNSDNAMYQAKSFGRNRYVFYDKKLEEQNAKRNITEEILHLAIKNKQFVLYYQPKVDTISGKILGLEALVRVNSPKYGIITPGDFIPLAEDLGLIEHIDILVLEEACIQYNKWLQDGLGKTHISLNLSPIQLRNKKVVSQYMNILKQYEIDPTFIQFEITENSLIDNEEMALDILQDFKSHGVSIALDDFGTGYSSLSCINLYPIDTVKIDRSFVKDSVSNNKNSAIIHAIAHLAKNLSLKLVAEGVETKEQFELIRSLHCDEIQGFYFYKPSPADIITQIFKENLWTFH